MEKPILYSFRRCPYAMRARLGLQAAKLEVELREVLLRDKPQPMLDASPKGTVPVLILSDKVLEESHDILKWALGQNDPEGLLRSSKDADAMNELITQSDHEFKPLLDRYKYDLHNDVASSEAARNNAKKFLNMLNERLQSGYLFGDKISMADLGIWPFVRQFAHVDRDWFWGQDWPHLIRWLDEFLASDRFNSIMEKHAPWKLNDAAIIFPPKPLG